MSDYLKQLRAIAEQDPDRPALRDQGQHLTYGELHRRVEGCAASLVQDHGIGHGSRVVLYLANSCDAVISLLALLRLRAVFCILSQMSREFHLRHILEDCAPALILTDTTAQAEYLAGIAPPQTPSTPVSRVDAVKSVALAAAAMPEDNPSACLIYTSGSTGMPRARPSRRSSMEFAGRAIQAVLKLQSDDRIGCVLPLSFDYGLYQVFLTLLAGAELVLGDQSIAGPQIARWLSDNRITVFPLSPGIAQPMARMARRSGLKLPELRLVTSTGSHFSSADIDALLESFPTLRIAAMYGLTECKRVSILPPEDIDRKPGSVGLPLPGTRCWIRGEDGAALAPGNQGELVIEGAHVMDGYWNAEALTAQRFELSGELRRLYSGDICSMDEQGYLYFHGRRDDTYKRGGFRANAFEIEHAARTLKGVDRAAAFILSGEQKVVLAVETGLLDVGGIRAALAEMLEPYKLPDEIVLYAQIPRNANGKTNYAACRERLSP
jgi:acyl-CoA synthetase (AMP-forming)/AMP-acid ligase II